MGFLLGTTPILCKEYSCYKYDKPDNTWKIVAKKQGADLTQILGYASAIVVDSSTVILINGMSKTLESAVLSMDGKMVAQTMPTR